ncbi:MAG: AI-2E family transporter [Gammaproteobacteria bacterium]|nr:AI-2E family transporter [Gammaproteobacteria bacterium]
MKTLNFTASAILVIAVFYILIVGEALLLPLVVAITLWYLINLLASGFARISLGSLTIPSPLCLLASVLTFVALGWGVVNFIGSSIIEISEVTPAYQANIEARIRSMPFSEYLIDQETGNFSGFLLDSSWLDLPAIFTSLASTFTSMVTSGGTIFIYIIFLMLEQGNIDKKISSLVQSEEKEKKVRSILKKIGDDIRKYISIKMFTSSLTGILSYTFLVIVGVDFAAVWGLLIFMLNFIPTVGSIIATIFPAVIALAQFEGYTEFVLVLVGIGAFQMAIGNFLEPKMMGTSFNLSPLLILLNLGLWWFIWGVIGMFLCVPFLIIIFIVLAHFPQTRPIAVMLSSDGNVGFIED